MKYLIDKAADTKEKWNEMERVISMDEFLELFRENLSSFVDKDIFKGFVKLHDKEQLQLTKIVLLPNGCIEYDYLDFPEKYRMYLGFYFQKMEKVKKAREKQFQRS